MASTEYERGWELCQRLHGAHSGEAIVALLKRVCPDYVEMNMEWAYAGITGRPGLPLETRALILIAACICRDDLPAQVKAYVEAALGLGVSKTAIVETILQTLPIAGFPAVTNAFVAAQDVL
ncbi:MAG TPA: carboxymuconolactone decarboxylase family protein [Vicinamibacterales bacterium]